MKSRAFTLVEVLIVVIVLGILAAITVPQFSTASSDANLSSLTTDLQIIRGQLQLYKVQHGDTWPTSANFAAQMTGSTDITGAVASTQSTSQPSGNGNSYPYGPYLQATPKNPYTGTNTVGAAANYSTAWYYDSTTGTFKANDSAGHAAY